MHGDRSISISDSKLFWGFRIFSFMKLIRRLSLPKNKRIFLNLKIYLLNYKVFIWIFLKISNQLKIFNLNPIFSIKHSKFTSNIIQKLHNVFWFSLQGPIQKSVKVSKHCLMVSSVVRVLSKFEVSIIRLTETPVVFASKYSCLLRKT